MAQGRNQDRTLAAVLFTDIVGSTRISEELGDRRWKAVLDQHNRMVRAELKRFGGRELDTAGDGFFASFNEPASAIACACAAVDVVRDLGLEIRAGVHFGECERVGKKLTGITVVIGARIMGVAEAGDVLVSSTASELARGAGFGFEDMGLHELKGVEDRLQVARVISVDGTPRPAPPPPEEAKARRDRIMAGAPRSRERARWISAAAAVLALGVGATLFFTLGGTPTEAVTPGPNSIARIDLAGTAFDQVIPLGSRADPVDLTFGGGRLWVANVTNRTVLSIDPESERGDAETFGVPSIPTGTAFGDGHLWVTFGFSSDERQRVGMLDPSRGSLDPAPFSVPDGSYPVAVGAGAVWIADPLSDTLTRFDLATRQVEALDLPTGSRPIDLDLAANGESLWVASGIEPAVYRLDTASPADPPGRFTTGDDVPTAIAVDPDGAVWIVSEDQDAVVALDASGASRVNTQLDQRCNGPVSAVASTRDVWISCALSRTVVRLSASDGALTDVLRVRGIPGAMTAGPEGQVWVAVQS